MMKKLNTLVFLFFILFVVTPILAKEPTNLGLLREELIRYHDSGAYDQEIKTIIQQASVYLKKQIGVSKKTHRKLAIILDIDDTAISNYPNMLKLNFGGTNKEIDQELLLGNDPVIKPTLKLYQLAKKNHIAVFFITGRDERKRNATLSNLKKAGYLDYEGLITRPERYKNTPAAEYKCLMRDQVAAKGYQILMSVGDQDSDLVGHHTGKTFKLPNPFYYLA